MLLWLMVAGVALAGLETAPPATPPPSGAKTPAPALLPPTRPAVRSLRVALSLAHPYVNSQHPPGEYRITFYGVGDLRVDPSKVHVDRVREDGSLERADVAPAAAAYRPEPSVPALAIVSGSVSVPRSSMRPGLQRLRVRADPGAVTRDGVPLAPSVVKRPGDDPLLYSYLSDDSDLRYVRAFIGRDVTSYGSITLWCGSGTSTRLLDTGPHVRLRISAVRRTAGISLVLRPGSAAFAGNRLRYEAIDPLEVVVDGQRAPALGCARPMFRVAGRWDFERSVGTDAPSRTLGEDVEIGMTHADVAYVLGYPPSYTPKAAWDGIPVWRYVNGPDPDAWPAVRFTDDRVSSFERLSRNTAGPRRPR
ncbi:MAG TPA: hypothetical protein VGD01_01300 [Candidatus Elarobacter sp.]